MKVSLNWLKEYVKIKITSEELAEKLTMAGLEVSKIESIGGAWDNIVVGVVIDVKPHPDADRLKLVTIDLGTQQNTVVCGAANISFGQKVPFAHMGAKLIDSHTGDLILLKSVKIRGIVSEGMVCSEKELGISNSHEGIMVLPPEAPIGIPMNDFLSDVILDIDVTPNRPDCLSVIGIAREISALTGEELNLPVIHYEEAGEPIKSSISVDIVDTDLCPRYCASLITGIELAPSPGWLQQRLKSYGMRSINNVVDVTNYVMLEYGQPLHAFDYHRIQGKHIIVRRAMDGENITTLDGMEHTLIPGILLITDKEEAVAVAGIMGGINTEVIDETSTILLESANFNQAAIRRGCSILQLQSEASIRFDKGLNSNLPLLPLKRATQLLLDIAGGKAAKGIIDVYPGKRETSDILLSVQEVKRLSGLDVTVDSMVTVLKTLGFECHNSNSGSQIAVTIPYWRSDVNCSADLVEEIIRIIGYDKIPVTMLSSSLPAQESMLSLVVRQRDIKNKLRNILTGCGFQEIITYSLVSMEKLQKLSPNQDSEISPLKVVNPMTREQEYLRTSLKAGLLTTLLHNQKFEQSGIRLFEIGKIFLPEGKELPEEREMLCAVLSGSRTKLSWLGDKEPLGYFDAKGIAESLLNQLGLEAIFGIGSDESLFVGKSADIIIGNEKTGIIGELHPKVAQAFDLSGTVCLIELDLEKILTSVTKVKGYQSISRFPSVSRDIALIVDGEVNYGQVKNIIQDYSLVTDVVLFDLYQGEQIPEGNKSFAIRVIYQSPDRTLTDEEVDQTQQQILDRFHQELSAVLRSLT